MFSIGWMDLRDPESTYEAYESIYGTADEAGKYYDYTLYLTPTVYKVAKGHVLKLLVTAQDPYRSRWDEKVDATKYFKDDKIDEVYSFVIDNESVEVVLPVND